MINHVTLSTDGRLLASSFGGEQVSIVILDRAAKKITLAITPVGSSAPTTPKDLHVFDDAGLLAYELPQKVTPDGKGGFVLELPVSDEGPKDAPVA